MKEINYVELFKINNELIEKLKKIQQLRSNSVVDSKATYLFYSTIRDNLITNDDIEKEYDAITCLNKYLDNEINLGRVSLLSNNDILAKVQNIHEEVYGSNKQLYNIAIKYIEEEVLNLKNYSKEELVKIENRMSKHLPSVLGDLFGSNKGNIIGSFNIGMYNMTQTQLHDVFKRNNIVYKNDRFIDIMNEDLLRYRLAGIRLISDNIDAIYSNKGISPGKLDRSYILEDDQNEYYELKNYCSIIGMAVKNLYHANSGLSPFEQLKTNGYQEQLSIDSINNNDNTENKYR